ncbi:MAG TPA: hypothetical protein VHO25_01875, partial [Polyangiaceae bacterium]|nr:hypothetical protein [Polyangiaceae bacterium]
MHRLLSLALLVAAAGFSSACGKTKLSEEGGETHFLVKCDDDDTCTAIDDGLRCEEGYCQPAASTTGATPDAAPPLDTTVATALTANGSVSGPQSIYVPPSPSPTNNPTTTEDPDAGAGGTDPVPNSSPSTGNNNHTNSQGSSWSSLPIPTTCDGVSDEVKPTQLPLPDGGIPPYGMLLPYASRSFDWLKCPGSGASGWGNGLCFSAKRCLIPCETALDCPDPGSGDALMECLNNSTCVMRCDDGQTCPDGMQCVPRPTEEQSWCMWVNEGEDERFDCWLENHPNGCADLTTKESCEARINASPTTVYEGCIWVRESILSTDSNSCQGTTTERCITGTSCSESDCGIGTSARCAECGTLAYISDLGNGTASLIETDYKGYQPSSDKLTQTQWEQCQFDTTPTLPLLCGCACGGQPASAGDDVLTAPPPDSCTGVTDNIKPRKVPTP